MKRTRGRGSGTHSTGQGRPQLILCDPLSGSTAAIEGTMLLGRQRIEGGLLHSRSIDGGGEGRSGVRVVVQLPLLLLMMGMESLRVFKHLQDSTELQVG